MRLTGEASDAYLSVHWWWKYTHVYIYVRMCVCVLMNACKGLRDVGVGWVLCACVGSVRVCPHAWVVWLYCNLYVHTCVIVGVCACMHLGESM